MRDGKDLTKYNSVEGLCIQKFYKKVVLLRRAMCGSECNGEQFKRTCRPENNTLEKFEKRFKGSIMFFSRMNFRPDSEGEDRDQEQVDVMNNFLEEENEATKIEESVNHTQYFVPCQG